MIDWNSIDTVLLDMDGTLLDLAYDNTLWSEVLPERFALSRGLDIDQARHHLFEHMTERRGQLEFYCLDYWARFTGLDIVALHHELVELITWRPHATTFLDHLSRRSCRSMLVTNAHRTSLAVKDRHSGLSERLDTVVSCHDFGTPKETDSFWQQLQVLHPFDPDRTLLIDDNAEVLDAAREFGIAHVLTIAQPDSARPPRENLSHPAVRDFRELLPAEPAGELAL